MKANAHAELADGVSCPIGAFAERAGDTVGPPSLAARHREGCEWRMLDPGSSPSASQAKKYLWLSFVRFSSLALPARLPIATVRNRRRFALPNGKVHDTARRIRTDHHGVHPRPWLP